MAAISRYARIIKCIFEPWNSIFTAKKIQEYMTPSYIIAIGKI